MAGMRKIESTSNLSAGNRPVINVSKKQLINRLNYINFQNDTVLLKLKHRRFEHSISLPAKTRPCNNDQLDCIWADPHQPFTQYATYDLGAALIKQVKTTANRGVQHYQHWLYATFRQDNPAAEGYLI